MSKVSTIKIQQQLVEIGEQLGFKAVMEFSFTKQHPYNPRYDIVWLLDVETLNIAHLQGIELIENKWLPFATFEVEGSTTSSKNQVGNIGNLYISPCQFHFIIVDNQGAGKENDTYRRGVKIIRTMKELLGNKQIIFLDASMLAETVFEQTEIHSVPTEVPRLKGSGGETVSLSVAEKVTDLLAHTNLSITFDQVPNYFKMHFQAKKQAIVPTTFLKNPATKERKAITSLSQYYYCPKIDISAGFYLVGGFITFLKQLAMQLEEDCILYPLLYMLIHDLHSEQLYFPLLGIEIECSDSKHAIGGLVNAGRFHQVGWIVGNDSLQGAVQTYQYFLGLRNTHFISIDYL